MILIALGSNQPLALRRRKMIFAAAITQLQQNSVVVEKISRYHLTLALDRTGQPPYLNAVLRAHCDHSAGDLLTILHHIEANLGRRFRPSRQPLKPRNRTLDLDLLDYHGIRQGPMVEYGALILPHPGLSQRPFVLAPIIDIAPEWRHPILNRSAAALLAQLPRRGSGTLMASLATKNLPTTIASQQHPSTPSTMEKP